MKKILLLSTVITGMVIIGTSCNKTGTDGTQQPSGGGTTNNPPSSPYLDVILSRDTAWYNDADTCSFTSNGTVKQNNSNEVSNPIIYNNITSEVNFQLSSTIYDPVTKLTSLPTIKNVKIPFYSAKRTALCKNVKLYRVSNAFVNKDSVDFPNAYHNLSVSNADTLYYYPNGNCTLKRVNGQTVTSGHWEFLSNETVFATGPNDPSPWNISQLDGSFFKIWQDAPNGYNPNIIDRTFLVYKEQQIQQ